MGLLRRRINVKKRVKGNNAENRPLRTLYADMFKGRGLLPDILSRQSPFVLFKMLDDLDDTMEEYMGDDPYLKIFYGQ